MLITVLNIAQKGAAAVALWPHSEVVASCQPDSDEFTASLLQGNTVVQCTLFFKNLNLY